MFLLGVLDVIPDCFAGDCPDAAVEIALSPEGVSPKLVLDLLPADFPQEV